MKFSCLISLAFISILDLKPPQKPVLVYKDRHASVPHRVKDLLSRMTLREKILQLNQHTLGLNNNINNVEDKIREIDPGIGSLIYFDADPVLRNSVQKKAMEQSRLGIPIIFGADVIHGFKTIYPIPLAIACSWNTALSSEVCAVAAREARLSGVDWTFSPMIDIGRDPRWGRVAEGYGEDPYTNAIFGAAAVQAYQGNSLSDPYSVAACLKHYVGYGVSEGGRDYRYTDISGQALWETYLVPYKSGIKAGAVTVMSAFNDISGIPATANPYTLNDILKKRWGHRGFVVADWRAVEQLISQGIARDRPQAAEKALMAGVDMDMLDDVYLENLESLVKAKKIPLARIDDAVSRILTVKFSLGLFDNPFATVVPETQRYLRAADVRSARAMAEESIVLLKNNGNVLPLNAAMKRIALIGPMADDSLNLLGSWSSHGAASDVTTIKKGLMETMTGAVIRYEKGADFDGNDQHGFDKAFQAAAASDVILLCLGEKNTWSGENASRSVISLPLIQQQLFQKLKQTGKPMVVILTNGRPLELGPIAKESDAIIEAWQPGVTGGDAIAGILSGRVNPSGKLAITFPLTEGQIPVYYNMRQSARPYEEMGNYQDISSDPLYWFGYGLSYTNFKYGDIKLSSSSVSKNGRIHAEIEVTNSGAADGKETVLWYISNRAASISRPVKELKHFEKKLIRQGEKVVFSFTLEPGKALTFPDSDGKTRLESGKYMLIAGEKKIFFNVTD